MRKLKLQVQTTIDGFVGGPDGEMDWMSMDWDDEIKNYVKAITDPVECIVLGRKLAEGFIPYWTSVAANPADLQHEAGKKFTDTHKVVFTKTLEASQWHNTLLAKGALADEILKLKNKGTGDIIAYGGASFVSSLIREDLIDEYHISINPTAIGRGLAIFSELEAKRPMKLVKATTFNSGEVVLHYERMRS